MLKHFAVFRNHMTFSFISVLLIVAEIHSVEAAVWNITYPRSLSANDQRNLYPLKVLELALDATGVRYTLTPSDKILLQAKSIRQLKENRDINVIWTMTSIQREKDLLPIRIPITKGLIGWRVLLIRESDGERFSVVRSLRELRSLHPVQGLSWPDTKILQSNGFNVETVVDFLDAISAIQSGTGDFLPRSIPEVLPELRGLPTDSDIVLEPNLLLHYPAAHYFFVNKANKTLANLIENGLRITIENGDFERLFEAHFEDIIPRLNIENRQMFRLSNPQIPDETPLDDASLWYELKKLD